MKFNNVFDCCLTNHFDSNNITELLSGNNDQFISRPYHSVFVLLCLNGEIGALTRDTI